MSYGGYQQQGGYGQPNPYDQRNYGGNNHNNYNQGGGYGQGGDVEMQNMQGGGYNSGGYGAAAPQDPNAILNACRDVTRDIDGLEKEIGGLQSLQYNILHSSGDSRDNQSSNTQLERANDNIIATYQSLIQRIRKIKGMPGSGEPRNAPQVGRTERRLKETYQNYQNIERNYRHELEDSIGRQYKIVRPDASDQEVREATQNPTGQVFTQALMQSNRRGQAQSTLNNVSQRHDAIQKIERDMITLAQLFQDLEQAVVEQEPMVEQIEHKGEEVSENVTKANTELTGAIDKAKAAKRKKWICLGICVLVLLIIIAIVVIVVEINKKK